MFQFSIDRGGTFTDIFARCPNGVTRVLKLLSDDPQNYNNAPLEGIRRIIQSELNIDISHMELIDDSLIDWIRMGTTVATNALLERKGERVALVVTAGFKDLLKIGNQTRPRIFDLDIKIPDTVYECVIEAKERVILKQEKCDVTKFNWSIVNGIGGEPLYVRQQLDLVSLRDDLSKIYQIGIRSIAVVLMHSYTFDGHEKQIEMVAREMGFINISLSSVVMPMTRIVPRGFTTCLDAYLTPCIQRYLTDFSSGFVNNLNGVNVLFMQSDGGLTPKESFFGSRAILSGPAGGVVGYSKTVYESYHMPVIGFDMGGTSTDVSRYSGSFDHVFESNIGGITIMAPQLDINTVAAGGGSMIFFRSGLFVVGPESAGAFPGPTCYGNDGPLTITDANLILGRLLPQYFPRIFGKKRNCPLDKDAALAKFNIITNQINMQIKSDYSIEEVAMGFLDVANESMCRPIRAITEGKGYDASDHVLACFGGAGGQHACAVARTLHMRTVFIHRYAGILSAYGMALADVVHEEQIVCGKEYVEGNFPYFDLVLCDLRKKCEESLFQLGFKANDVKYELYLNMRFCGTDCAFMCMAFPSDKKGDFKTTFLNRYKHEFGFILERRSIVVDDIRVRALGVNQINHQNSFIDVKTDSSPEISEFCEVYFQKLGFVKTKVYFFSNLMYGHRLVGPAIVIDNLSTLLVEPLCTAEINYEGHIIINIAFNDQSALCPSIPDYTSCDPVQLSIFSHRFMSIAEQMGQVLQRTSISTNIKERLDFSCALFGPDGGLVSNAPHIPVHLGAMQEAVKYQISVSKLKRGDVLLSNHPKAGGSHLPDLTIITPVFNHQDHSCEPIFFVANRGHHADIGGISPGSMPPHSKYLYEEGAQFKSFKIVTDNELFHEDELIEKLVFEPSQWKGCSGTRCLRDNLSDLKAQISANHRGIQLVHQLIADVGLKAVQTYMAHIQVNAELAVRDMLRSICGNLSPSADSTVIKFAEDAMDDGSKIVLLVSIDSVAGSAIFDFTGSSSEVDGNTNAPRAVTLSAIIYCLRCLVGHDIPLNQGCMKPITVIIPEGSILDPSEDAAVVGGNVLTSQRIVDVVLKAFNVCAASQGCCNNITFGDDSFGYYETVGGGSGAGPSWHGRSGVHVHMTNTRMTDPEIFEHRLPAVLECFSLAQGTGGKGLFKGGDGIDRKIRFRRSLCLSVLTERRIIPPYGLEGGDSGHLGVNILRRAGGTVLNLGGKAAVNVYADDVFCLQTPGGGGYGKAT